MLFVVLSFKLFCPVHIRIGDFDLVNDHTDATDEIDDKRFFIDAVTVPECVPVKKDISCNGLSIHCKEKVKPQTVKWLKETWVSIVQRRVAVGTGAN